MQTSYKAKNQLTFEISEIYFLYLGNKKRQLIFMIKK